MPAISGQGAELRSAHGAMSRAGAIGSRVAAFGGTSAHRLLRIDGFLNSQTYRIRDKIQRQQVEKNGCEATWIALAMLSVLLAEASHWPMTGPRLNQLD